MLRTAFLQPVHEPPHHYYNTTEFGLRRWFADFEITTLHVSPNFNPAYVLAWLSSAITSAVAAELGPEAAAELGRTDLATLATTWTDPSSRDMPAWQILRRLSPELQKHFSAGFHLEAVKERLSRSGRRVVPAIRPGRPALRGPPGSVAFPAVQRPSRATCAFGSPSDAS